jgi:hypothetical protein
MSAQADKASAPAVSSAARVYIFFMFIVSSKWHRHTLWQQVKNLHYKYQTKVFQKNDRRPRVRIKDG